MQQTTNVATAGRCGALTALLIRYVTGQIAETTWNRFSTCVDGVRRASREEREALATFLNDVTSEIGAEAVRVPDVSEAEDVLRYLRQS